MTRVAFKEATVRPINQVAGELQEVLGQRLVAYAAGVRSPKLVGRWATGEHEPREDAMKRLRELYEAVLTLREHYGAETIRAFMVGANPNLEDCAPIDVVRDGRGIDVVRAAEAFLN